MKGHVAPEAVAVRPPRRLPRLCRLRKLTALVLAPAAPPPGLSGQPAGRTARVGLAAGTAQPDPCGRAPGTAGSPRVQSPLHAVSLSPFTDGDTETEVK